MQGQGYLSVSSLNQLIKDRFDADPFFNDVLVKGELSNCKLYPSGHMYFSLKDKESLIKGVMWTSYVYRLGFIPKDGDEVILHGKVSVYPQRGEYQIYADGMQLFGAGDELRKLKELTEKLRKEGLFDESRKRRLPKFPSRVGLITAKNSAAIKDMRVNLLNRWPLVEIIEFPSSVQGKEAPKELLEAFKTSQTAELDVLIIGRGGGSSEDLGAFNDEDLVRALASSNCPTISAVGHEIDVTLTDLVADRRVSTPTGAAVAAVPDKNEIMMTIDSLSERLSNSIGSTIEGLSDDLEKLAKRPFFEDPSTIYVDKIEQLRRTFKELTQALEAKVSIKKEKQKGLSAHLLALSPYGVLNRGYSITMDAEGKIVSSIDDVSVGETLVTRVSDGIIESNVSKEPSHAGKEK